VGDQSKPKIVLIHGYGGSAAQFYAIYKGLMENFSIYAVDMIGMGGSTRAAFNCRNGVEADNFFINFVEAWRAKMDLTDFTLIGHSYGGYTSSIYAYSFP